jgi:hypothetical protein
VALLFVADGAKAAEEKKKPLGLVVESWVSTAGPYGQSWTLRIAPSGEASLHVLYMASPTGTLLATFSLSAEHLADIRKAVETERFFELPANIAPKSLPMHRPALRLDIWLEGKQHTVEVYDPAQFDGDVNASHFFAVWKKLYENLPIKPSW